MLLLLLLSVTLVTISQANFIASPKHSHRDWYETAIFYQIYPRSFKDSDGDGIGDIKGVISKLEHLKEMGVGGTWLSPIFKSPMKDFGYDISDFYGIQEEYGTMEDAVELFEKAKELDIKIILDFVPNHSSDQCEWFLKSVANDSEYRDYYIWHEGVDDGSGGRKVPNNWNSVFYGHAWTWKEERQAFYFHQFDKAQPDLNYRNPKVVEEMKKVLRFWLDKGASGFRVDAVNHLFEVEDLRDEPIDNPGDDLSYGYTHKHYTKDLDEVYDMIYQWREVLDEFQEANGGETRIMMSEAYANQTFTMKYYESASGRQGSHMPFNFVLINELSEWSKAADFKRVIDSRINALPTGRMTNWVIGNHDQPRVGSRYGAEKIDSLLTLVMTLPGIAVTYNGEEIGMVDFRYGISFEDTVDPQACNAYPGGPRDGWEWASRDPVRTPYQWDASTNAGFCQCGSNKTWLPVNTNYQTLNLEAQKSSDNSTFKFYKELSELRKDDTMMEGAYESFVVNEVFAFTRTAEGHDPRLVLINFGETEEVVDVTKLTDIFGSRLRVLVAGTATIYEKGEFVNTGEVKLPKYNTIVVENSAASATLSLSLAIIAVFRYMYV